MLEMSLYVILFVSHAGEKKTHNKKQHSSFIKKKTLSTNRCATAQQQLPKPDELMATMNNNNRIESKDSPNEFIFDVVHVD